MAVHAARLEERPVTCAGGRSKLVRVMDGPRNFSRALMVAVSVAAVSVLAAAPQGAYCPSAAKSSIRVAGEGKQPENRGTRDRCKRTDNSRTTPPKGCPEGGERLPQDNKRSPLDEAPPLSPLVA